MDKKRICILSFSKITWDSRVLREISLAAKYYAVDVIGYGSWQSPENVNYHELHSTVYQFWQKFPLMILGRIFPAFWDRFFWIKKEYRQAETLILQDGGSARCQKVEPQTAGYF